MGGARRRRALGLGGRIVGALLVSTAITLGVAAMALLGPLQESLRNAELKTLRGELGKSATSSFKRLDLTDLPLTSQAGHAARTALERQQQQLASRVGGVVTALGYPDPNGRGQLLLPESAESDTTISDPFDDVAAAFRSDRAMYSFGSIGNTQYVRVALPFRNAGLNYVLAVRKPIDEIAGAVDTVRTAFITAALAGLALTLILGIPLAATLVRRLRRLRQAALQFAERGTAAVDVPVDRTQDEVGDLARAFALMQRQLHQQEEARRAFVATASHELRTPLASLDGMLELLDDDLRGGTLDLEDSRLLLLRARAQSRRLGRLAADLLDLSRIDADVQLRSEPVELGELSRAVLAEFELGTAERGISSALDDSAGPVWALGDPGSVARIVRILLDNAVRASAEGAEVRVELRNGAQATVSVCDEGPGVPPEERELIFQRFQRGRDTGGQAGFGLGLAIGRELADRMGGELVLEDQEGPGAKFTLRLPVARAPDQEPAWVS
jgi:signal transduction histidine kinase